MNDELFIELVKEALREVGMKRFTVESAQKAASDRMVYITLQNNGGYNLYFR